MANQFKGEVEFAGSKFRFDIDAICRTEDAINMGLGEMLVHAERGIHLGVCRAILRASRVADPKVEFDVNSVIEEHGLKECWRQTLEIISLALPTPQDGGEADPTQNRGTGNDS